MTAAGRIVLGRHSLVASRPVELMRDFIHDCLYNPHTGYFQRHVNIVQPFPRLDYNAIRHAEDYYRRLRRLYQPDDGRPSRANPLIDGKRVSRQSWHTPSEIFSPWYGEGIARFLTRHAHRAPTDPLVIYEVGPGNGTLANDILSWLARTDVSLYARTEYHLIEVSQRLSQGPLQRLTRQHPQQVRLHPHDFFAQRAPRDVRRVTLIFAEVFDNLPQDRVRFVPNTGDLEQAVVVTNDEARWSDEQSRYTQVFIPAQDRLILTTVNALETAGHRWPSLRPSPWTWLTECWPLSHFDFERPWATEFIPTGAYAVLQQLHAHYPNHQLLLSDFHELPDRTPGHGAPVVQTLLEGEMVACSTVLLERGLFDIFFPHDFGLLARLYRDITGRPATVMSHADFCLQHMDCAATRTLSGFNPLLEEYKNVSFMYT